MHGTRPQTIGYSLLDSPAGRNELDRGGHFAAWEQPGLFIEEVRAVGLSS
jgi:hypothetical protein